MICALGNDTPETWNAVCEGRSGIAPIHSVDVSELRFQVRRPSLPVQPGEHFEANQLRLLDPFSQFAVIAAREAVQDSGITLTPALREKTAIVTGSGMGGQSTLDEGLAKLYQRNQGRVNPLIIPRAMANAGASHISMEFGITGPAYTDLHGLLFRQPCHRSSLLDGSQWHCGTGHCRWQRGSFQLRLIKGLGGHARHISGYVPTFLQRPSRFDSRGRRRNADIGTSRCGEGTKCEDSCRSGGFRNVIGRPSPHTSLQDGPVRAMRAALLDARLRPEQVGYVNAHGSGTLINDPLETRAIRELFGAHADQLAVSSTKSLHGHVLGATGAMEAVCTVLALENGLLPPTANFTVPDPDCNLDVVPNRARPAQVEFALSNSFAFGGLNAVLAFRGLNH